MVWARIEREKRVIISLTWLTCSLANKVSSLQVNIWSRMSSTLVYFYGIPLRPHMRWVGDTNNIIFFFVLDCWPTSLFTAKCTTADSGEGGGRFRVKAAWSDNTSLVILLPNTWRCDCTIKRTELHVSFHDHTHVISCSGVDLGRGMTNIGHQLRLSLILFAIKHIHVE